MKPEEVPAVGTRVTAEIKQPWDVHPYEMKGTIAPDITGTSFVWIRPYRSKRWCAILKAEDILSLKVGW